MLVNGKWKIVYRNAAFWSAKKTKQTIHHSLFTIHRKGFTLIELLVVIGILTILLAIVLVAINPAKQFAQANNTQRRSDVNAILNAIHQYAADNKGVLPTGIDTTVRTICTPVGVGGCTSNTAVDLCDVTNANLVPDYVADLPLDPTDGTTDAASNEACSDLVPGTSEYNTGYTVVRNATNRVTVAAPNSEAEGSNPAPTISVTR